MTRPSRDGLRPIVVSAILFATMLSAAATGDPRDSARVPQDATAGAEISGTIVTANDPAIPIARALVTASGPSLTPSRTIVSDDRGRFAFQNLPAGSVTIVAARSPYVKTAYGAKRPGRLGTPITLSAGQRVSGLTLALARGAVITGVVFASDGAAAPDITIEVTPLDAPAGRPAFGLSPGRVEFSAGVPAGPPIVTDDRGVYRAFGLAPGRYVVTAKVIDDGRNELTQFSDAEMDEILARLQRRSAGLSSTNGALGASPSAAVRPSTSQRAATYGYAPIYYPGTPDADQATTLVLSQGEERAGIDIGLRLVPTAAIAGRVSVAAGVSGNVLSRTQVTLMRRGARGGAPDISNPTRQPDSAGAFRFTGIPPGTYRVVAHAMMDVPIAPATGPPLDVFWALSDVTVGGDDVPPLALTLQPGLRFSGRVVFDRHTKIPPGDLTAISLRLADVDRASILVPPSGRVRADGTFEIRGILPGTYGLAATPFDTGWSLRSVMVADRDLLDVPLQIGPGGDVSGAVVTFTDRHTELSGTLQTAANVPAPDYFVVAFPSEPALWQPSSRRIQSTRPATDGRFVLRDLPAGDYLIAALTDMETSDLVDRAFLQSLVATALSLHLDEGETKVQTLRLTK